MKNLSSSYAALALIAIFSLVNTGHAEVTFDWATVGDDGNTADPLNAGIFPGIGSVPYKYRISKHEVTNAQYVEFLNSVASADTNGLFKSGMSSDILGGITRSGSPGSFTYSVKSNMGNKPANYVSYFDAMRFVNWLHNSQPVGAQDASTTESGVYAINDGLSETRAANAKFFIPTENEWYKAAYYDPTPGAGGGDNYWLYATASDIVPTLASANAIGSISNPGPNVANYDFGADWNSQDGNVTTVGSAGVGSENFYGTFDQAGNVWEMTETVGFGGTARIQHGGSRSSDEVGLRSSTQTGGAGGSPDIGFRVADKMVPVPTASVWGVAVMALLVLVTGTISITRVCYRRMA